MRLLGDTDLALVDSNRSPKGAGVSAVRQPVVSVDTKKKELIGQFRTVVKSCITLTTLASKTLPSPCGGRTLPRASPGAELPPASPPTGEPTPANPTPAPLPLFSSRRERRLWVWAAVVVVTIYATLGLARTFTGLLSDRELISAAFWLGLGLIGVAVVVQGFKARLGGVEIGVALAIAGAYLILFLRMTVPEERSHLIEYSVVALLLYEALTERASQGRRVPLPSLIAVVSTALVGALDEGMQALLPSRVFDPVDMLFNLLAAVMAVAGSATLRWTREKLRARTARSPRAG